MVEVENYGNATFPAEGQQVLDSKGVGPVIVLQRQAGLAVGAQPLKVVSEAAQRGKLVSVHTSYVDVDLVPVAGLKPHQVQNLQVQRFHSFT